MKKSLLVSVALTNIRPTDAGWSSSVARRAHNPKVVGSNPAPATKSEKAAIKSGLFFTQISSLYLNSHSYPECLSLFVTLILPAILARRLSALPESLDQERGQLSRKRLAHPARQTSPVKKECGSHY